MRLTWLVKSRMYYISYIGLHLTSANRVSALLPRFTYIATTFSNPCDRSTAVCYILTNFQQKNALLLNYLTFSLAAAKS